VAELTALRARELFAYDPDSGALVWKLRSGQGVRNDLASTLAGAAHKDGYIAVTVDGRKYLAHRVVWLMLTGEWPTGEIDHRDGNRANNAWSNLRDVSKSVNQQNRRGVKGVDYVRRLGKWRARIAVNGKPMLLGFYPQEAQALDAYQTAKGLLHART
jgi:HNH endonuclease